MTRVVVLGGGVGGLSVAQELAERGFEVVILERRKHLGGKARSIDVPPTRLGPELHHAHHAQPPTPWAPGEHGFRFFPGFYRHVIDTMARIPAGPGQSVADSLVPTARVAITQYDRSMFELPARFPNRVSDALTVLQAALEAFSPVVGLRLDELAHFAAGIWQVLTSCPERRLAEYEKIPWWSFIGAESRSSAYQKFLASGITRSLVAAKARSASTRTIGNIFVQLVLTMVDPLAGSADRVLNGPTTDVWIGPWEQRLTSLGVEYWRKATVTGIRCDSGRITGVEVETAGHKEVVSGDHYVSALPVERLAPLLTPAMCDIDPRLASVGELAGNVEWMNGVQFYLRKPLHLTYGHVIHIDTEWALTSISQLQFWRREAVERYTGHTDIQDILSVDISDWEEPGLNGRPARECDRLEVALEVWEQLKRSINQSGFCELEDQDLSAWFMDPDIRPDIARPGFLTNVEPLLVNLADTWRLRPDAVTAIPNFFLASDYVRTHTDLATMEAANEAARRAANGVLDATAYRGARCAVWPLQEPVLLAPLRDYDSARFKLGLPWDDAATGSIGTGLDVAEPPLGEVASWGKEFHPLLSALAQVNMRVRQAEHALALGRTEQQFVEPLEQLRDITMPFTAPVPEAETAFPSAVQVAGPTASEAESRFDRAATSTVSPGLHDEGPTSFFERLEWYRQPVLEALDWAVPEIEPRQYLYGPLREFVNRPAKGLRPGLCLATCRSYGGTVFEGLPSATGLELLHHAFLVHDDIEDGSVWRRGANTLHRQVGEAAAINIGDALNAYAMRTFRSNVGRLGPQKALAIFDEVDHLLVESLEGQALELGWVREKQADVDVEDYLRMVLKKTAWYSFIHPMRIGALAAGAGDDLDRFNRFGFLLGAAFQIQDDVLNLTGSESRYGKEIGGDLWEGKRTVILAHAFRQAGPNQRARLEHFLSRTRQDRLPREVYGIYDVLRETGSIEWARKLAGSLADAAQDHFSGAFQGATEGPDLDFIRSLVSYLIERER